jgi:hypothetical protein
VLGVYFSVADRRNTQSVINGFEYLSAGLCFSIQNIQNFDE